MIPTPRTRPTALSTAVSAVFALLALAGCDERVAGTSVGTGNPTEIQVGFKDGTGSAALTGRVSVYASTQIPVEGYRPDPMLEYDLHDAGYASFKAADFAALPESLWAKGSVANGIHAFNVVFTGATQGSVLTGFGFDKSKGAFVLRPGDAAAVWSEDRDLARVKDSLRMLVDMSGTMDTAGIGMYIDYHLFLYGTGFTSKIKQGSFTLRGVPDGIYDAYLIPLPRKNSPQTGFDSAYVFATKSPLSPGTSSVVPGDVHERVRLPDSLITP